MTGPRTVDVVVETPRNSRNKYEITDTGEVRLDRRLPGAFAFPADYGFVPGATGSDGEPLDALVLTPEPTYPGVRVRARVVGVFWVMTGHGREAKVVCVPDGDPAFDGVEDLEQLPASQLAEIAHFFDIYRDLDPGKDVSCDGRDGVDAGWRVVEEARAGRP
ncbi:inorganic diphosphatase [Motilibacter deserti]|uniref:inorganic diphosphatase n=1 Tax=Motilibacter deserti TaxID=2714956 RepID=A0ABX0H0D9_9ACTN|nr:inorganic diphosphatase [Motilibacter deserti]